MKIFVRELLPLWVCGFTAGFVVGVITFAWACFNSV